MDGGAVIGGDNAGATMTSMEDGHIVRAVEDGKLSEVANLLQRQPRLVDARGGHQQWTPLMAATFLGRLDVVRWLLDRGASVDLMARDGATALLLAAVMGRLEVVSLLLERGASVKIKARGRCSGLILASAGGHLGIVKLFLKHDAGQVDEKNSEGRTALWKAAYGGHVEVAEALLLQGRADHTIPDRHGRTAKDVARQRGHHACVNLLEWYERELDRSYVLHRARCVHEDHLTRTKYPTIAPVPNHLQARTAAGKEPPSVQVMKREEEGNMGKKRPASSSSSLGEEEEEREVIAYVVERMNGELFRELSSCIDLRG